jgi:predicted HTH domain antitoxin
MTEELRITYPPGFENPVPAAGYETEQYLRVMAALKMFELGEISSGKAAELAGMSRIEFLETCGKYRVSVFNYPDEDTEAELRSELRVLESIKGRKRDSHI